MAVNDLADFKEDRPAYVRFEVRDVKDTEATLKEGHYKSKDEDWVMVSALGSRDVYNQRADKWFNKVEQNVDKGRTPIKHLELYKEIYKRWKEGLEPPVDGTSVKDWNALSPAQCSNLISIGLRTIEDIAQANDEAMRRFGMGGLDLRQKAKVWLQAGEDKGILTEKMVGLQRDNKQLQGTIDSLQDQVNLLQIQNEEQRQMPRAKSGWPINPTQVYKPSTKDEIADSEIEAKKEVRKLLFAEYESKFGKKPHGRMKNETIREHLKTFQRTKDVTTDDNPEILQTD